MSMWLGITNMSSRATLASLVTGHVKTYNMEIRLIGQMTTIKKKLKVGACGASDPRNVAEEGQEHAKMDQRRNASKT